jgi:hypothetical protein
VLRLPADSRAIAHEQRVRTGETGIEVIGSSAIRNAQNADSGRVAVAVAIDLKEQATELAHHVKGATVTGLDTPIVLVPVAAGNLIAITQPIKTKATEGLALVAQVDAPVAPKLPWLEPVRYAAFALAGLLLLVYIALAATRR